MLENYNSHVSHVEVYTLMIFHQDNVNGLISFQDSKGKSAISCSSMHSFMFVRTECFV